MSRARRSLRQAYAFVERSINIMKRYWAWEIVWITYDLTWALSTGFLALGLAYLNPEVVNIERTSLYLLIGAVMWTYVGSTFIIISNAITWERWEGTIEYTFMAPVSRFLHLAGSSLFALLYGLIRMILAFVLIAIVFKVDFTNSNFLAAFVLLVITTIPFVGLGMVAAVFPLMAPEQGAQATRILEAMMLMISGIFYPIEVLPVWMQYLAKISPPTYALQGVRDALLDGATLPELWKYIWPLLIMGVIFIPLGLGVFKAAENYAKRAGKLKRSG